MKSKKTVYGVFGFTKTGADYLIRSFKDRLNAVDFEYRERLKLKGQKEFEIRKIRY